MSVFPKNGCPSSKATRPICNHPGDWFKAAAGRFPDFQPHRLLRSGHLQTLAASLLPGKQYRYRATRRTVLLAEGDVMILHDDRPPGWQPTSPAALLIHGLAGSHQSPYMIRIAGKLNEVGVRTFRMDSAAPAREKGFPVRPITGAAPMIWGRLFKQSPKSAQQRQSISWAFQSVGTPHSN